MGPGPCTSSLKKTHCFPLASVFPSADSRGCLSHAGSGSVCQALGGEGTASGRGRAMCQGCLKGTGFRRDTRLRTSIRSKCQ